LPYGPEKWQRHEEMKYVSEYCYEFYPRDRVFLSKYVGTWPPPPEGEELEEPDRRLLAVRRGRADAVVVTSDRIIVIEAKIRPERYPDGLAKVQIYKNLVEATPELAEYLPRPIEAVLLTPILHPTVAKLADEAGVKNVVWSTKDIDEYLRRLYPYLKQVPRYE